MKNSSVITNEGIAKHFVENYRFKVLGSESRNTQNEQKESFVSNVAVDSENEATSVDENTNETQYVSQQAHIFEPHHEPQTTSGFDSSFVEELLKKTDELSGNIIKLQMQIENQEAEFNRRLEAEVLRAKEDGINEGLAQANATYEAQIKELNDRFNSSVAKISTKFDELDAFIHKNEEELPSTAISIANEVINAEVAQNSGKVAFSLATNLLKTLIDAKNITLRVNPSDSEYLSENFASKPHIKIEADDAISKGGVVIISEAGNIDANLSTRLENIKGLL